MPWLFPCLVSVLVCDAVLVFLFCFKFLLCTGFFSLAFAPSSFRINHCAPFWDFLRLFPPVLLPSSAHFYIESCRWTQGGGSYAEAHGRCNVKKKGSFSVFWSTSSFLLYPNILSLSICSCLPFHHPWSPHSGIWSGDLYNYWCLGYRSLILEVIFKNVKKELWFQLIWAALRIMKSRGMFVKELGDRITTWSQPDS